MKIAFFTNEKWLMETEQKISGSFGNGLFKIDYFSLEEKLLRELDRTVYDVILLYPSNGKISIKDFVRQVKTKVKSGIITLGNGKIVNLKQTKYIAFFYGQTYFFDVRDILFLESYYRKTSVVTEQAKIRIRARLDEEEYKLPKEQFVRINRHNLINMQHIRFVKEDQIKMINGENLYVSKSRKKKFEKSYQDFLELNEMFV
ncbi:LytTR family DNA-binding domain-containing protein [Clostridium sp. E02]|uniref:LytR/AlgR family response regulator transcription factor n=1 Tax=Clostridium sp. E02 TaxID=2487134 RepID=UPI000F5384FE|nr:LytTR family DNA-binding domain-containing protein [Clostridium sp. E02]